MVRWKAHTQTAVRSSIEATWCRKAAENSRLTFLNVQTTGLAGRPHSVLSGIMTTQEVIRSRIHVKMLSGDYLCNAYRGNDRDKDVLCQLCQSLHPHYPAPKEDMVHLITRCRATTDTRTRIMPELLNTIADMFPLNEILHSPNHTHLTNLSWTQPHLTFLSLSE